MVACSIPGARDARVIWPSSTTTPRCVERASALHEATGAASYLECGRRWLEQVEIHYRDRNGGYFFTADDAEALIARAKIARTRPSPPAMA